jgi:hypothetical protein
MPETMTELLLGFAALAILAAVAKLSIAEWLG